jgi:D-xylose 1-dehydrogenase
VAEYPELKGCNVVLTGGANGIGAATVRHFREQRAQVFFCDVDAAAGQALAKELGPDCHFTKVDLAHEREITAWIQRVAKKARRIHVLVNNAARDPRIPLEETTGETWDNLLATNLRAPGLLARECVPLMPRGGSIINLASITFYNSPALMSTYVATKGGIIGFTRSLARELGPKRIRVNTVSPGWIMTERQLRMYVTPAVKKLIKRSQCIPELNTPEEIAEVILFLASNASRAITGQEILVDRGWEHS